MASINGLTNNSKQLGLMVIVVAVVLAILQGFSDSGALGDVNATANQTINTGITEIGGLITDWLGIIVLIIVGSFLMSMKIFGNK